MIGRGTRVGLVSLTGADGESGKVDDVRRVMLSEVGRGVGGGCRLGVGDGLGAVVCGDGLGGEVLRC